MSDPAPARFPKTVRVRSRVQYARVFEAGRRHQNQVMRLHLAEAEPGIDTARFGLAVSRKVERRAVGRNRIKRVLREVFRKHRARLLPLDIVVVAKPWASTLDNAALGEAFVSLLRRSGALPPADRSGTMRGAFSLSEPCAAKGGRLETSISE